MADNKSTNTENTQGTNTENTQGKVTGSAKGKKNEKLVPVFIPKTSRGDTERFIAVNGERILVQTGKTVEIPERFAEVIRNSEAMAAEASAYIDANVSV